MNGFGRSAETARLASLRSLAATSALAVLFCAGAAVSAQQPVPEFAFIPAGDLQPNGPTHDFRIGRFEVRNDEFVAFLNDAMDSLDDERGQFMYFDVDTGDVYIHTATRGIVGTNGSGTLLFSATANPNVFFDSSAGRYALTAGRSDHPVTGVTWFGAIKFCNWLTLASGLAPDERIYVEAAAPDLDGWRPVTISADDWAVRDLTNAERQALLSRLGYRLPMDGGNEDGQAGPYNEWYKAAAWDPAARVNRVYGFGRDTLTGPDANYFDSGDPFDNDTTPVGYYDGTNHGGTYQTNPAGNENGYGLFDISGNVWEWVQDQSPSDVARRRERGGAWRSVGGWLRTTLGADRDAESADDATGLRVVQSVVNALLVTPGDELVASGPWGGPYDDPSSDRITYHVTNVTRETSFLVFDATASWLTVEVAGSPVVPGEPIDVPAGETVDMGIVIAPHCTDELVIGVNAATVKFRDAEGNLITERGVCLTVREPLSLSPPDGLVSEMRFGGDPAPPNMVYIASSASDSLVTWSARWEETTAQPTGREWLAIDAADGTVPPHGVWPIVVTIDAAETTSLDPGTYTADLTFTDDCTGETFARTVTLEVLSPFSVVPEGVVVSTGVAGGPFDPPSHSFTLANGLGDPMIWSAATCIEPPGSGLCTPPPEPSWLTLDTAGGSLPGDGTADLIAEVTAAAETLEAGAYSLTLRFEEPATGFLVERLVTLDVTGLWVEPVDDARFEGSLGGPFQPESLVYTLHNNGLPEMSWEASLAFDPPLNMLGDLNWLDLSPRSGVILDEHDVDEATLSITDDAASLPTGTFNATITFTANGAAATRQVNLIVGGEGFAIPMVTVPAAHEQPFGPGHDFRIGRFEVTNAEFAHFLNSARRNAFGGPPETPDGRSEYMYFDLDSGDVYINDAQTAGEGVDAPSATLTTHLIDTSVGRIDLLNGHYVVEADSEDHPVVGVSWFGAVKFCNWMTLVQGMNDPDERVYREGATPADWGPVGQAADLTSLRGFRLPMDGGLQAAGAFNEWYKAAAWLDSLEANSIYGFGRDALMNTDGNFRESGDPFEPDTSPVGFFDGVNSLAGDGGLTTDTANGYRLYDMTGNAAEWVHDLGATPLDRGYRGGHFDSQVESPLLRTDGRSSIGAGSTVAFISFRVAQAIEASALVLSRAEGESARAIGYVGGPYTFVGGAVNREAFTLQITNPGRQAVDGLSLVITPPWLEVLGAAPTLVPPGMTLSARLGIAEQAVNAGPSPAPAGSFVLVQGSEAQVEGPSGGEAYGPDYDFWIGRYEVTNTEFAGFLNIALDNVRSQEPDSRSQTMYFDLDSGSVYINDQVIGDEGTAAPSPTLTTSLYDASVGRIQFDGNGYSVASGFGQHPVVGVSWFGAVKYCNWLTLATGIPPPLRAYDEAPSPNLDGWHPVVVDDEIWATQGLPAGTRRFLVEDTLGYRLPMDDGAAGASAFNEWYKAGSRKAPDASGSPVFGAVYGFGRDTLHSGNDPLAGTDANYLASGDTEADGTTPVRLFDGVHSLYGPGSDCFPPPPDPPPTADTDNGYGLYDASGNVAEWMQDFGQDVSNRATRGGSWHDPFDSAALQTHSRRSLDAPSAGDDTGFRVVRGTGHVVTVTVMDPVAGVGHQQHFILDLREPFKVTPPTGLTHTGVYSDLFAGMPGGLDGTFALENRSAAEMAWEVSVDRAWIDLAGPVPDELSGTLSGGEAVTIDVTTNASVETLEPGVHTATVTFRNTTTETSQARTVELTIEQPIVVDPLDADPQDFTGLWSGPFDTLAPRTYELSSHVDFDLDYVVSAGASWLTVEPTDPEGQLSGTLDARAHIAFAVHVNGAANVLPVGDYDGTVRFTFIDPANDDLSATVKQRVTLYVDEPIAVTQAADPWLVGPNPDPETEQPEVYTLTNRADRPIEVHVRVDQPWVDVDADLLEVFPGPQQARQVTVSLNDGVTTLHDGEYTATLTFEDTVTGVSQCRKIVLVIEEDIAVAPFGDFAAAGIGGGPIGPPLHVYTVTNVARDDGGVIQWQAARQDPEADWLLINGGPTADGFLHDGESTSVVVSIDPEQTAGLAQGTHEAEVAFRVLPEGEPKTRTVSLRLVVPEFGLAESPVPAEVVQPGGPAYSYKIATFHTTNEQFVAFLNNAAPNPGNERGRHMFFDTVTGNVYVNSSVTGAAGPDPGLRATVMFSPAASGQIELTEGTYRVLTTPIDYSLHPVTGVSWYGALKFCNWLTVDQGILPSERCYREDTDANLVGWHPVTITTGDWAARDLSEDERLDLVTNYRGFRLPMDEGNNNVDVTTDHADEYNEWFKAAAWNDARRQNSVYGFGRTTLTGADANFRDSGDPLDNGTTPVGYFDGTTKNGSFATNRNENGFGVFDMTGNVYQWLQGRFNTHPDSIDFRTARGGSWNRPADALDLTTASRTFVSPGTTSAQVGFRVVRVPVTTLGDVDLDGDVDTADYAAMPVCLTGPAGSAIAGCPVLDLDADHAIDLRDYATFQTAFTGPP